MFDSVTPQQLIDDVEAMTDGDGYDLISNDQYVAWMNCEMSSMWQWCIRCNRDAFTKTAAGQVAAGQTSISITAAQPTGLGLTDFLNVRGVDLNLGGGNYKKIRPWNFATRDRVIMMAYRPIGESLWILPHQYSSLYPFRLWYVCKAPQASASALSTALSLPTGCDEYVKQGMAASVRIRFDDDPTPHQQAQAVAKAGVEAWLASSRGDQGVIADVSDDYWCELW